MAMMTRYAWIGRGSFFFVARYGRETVLFRLDVFEVSPIVHGGLLWGESDLGVCQGGGQCSKQPKSEKCNAPSFDYYGQRGELLATTTAVRVRASVG
jgi:hypothetical protein